MLRKFTTSALAAAAVSALTACSGASHGAPGAGLPTFVQSTARNSGTAHFNAQSPLLYVGSTTAVLVYNQSGKNQKPIATISGPSGSPFSTVGGLYVAGNGDLYVADIYANEVYVYALGASEPYKTLSGATNPWGVTMDQNGTVYTNNGYSNVVYVYAGGSTTPTSMLTANFTGPSNYCVTDAAGDLFVSADGEIDEFPFGSTTPVVLNNSFGDVWGMAVDSNQNLITTDIGGRKLSIYKPPYTKKPFKSVSEKHDQIFGVALGAGDSAIWFTDSSQGYSGWRHYPGLKFVEHTSTKSVNGSLYGIAAYPAGAN